MPRWLEATKTPMPPLDGRTKIAQQLGRFRRSILSQLGPNLTPIQAAQLELAIGLKRRLLEWEHAYGQRDQSDHDHRTFLGWASTLSRILAKLEPAKPPAPPEPKRRRVTDDLGSYVQRPNGGHHP